MRLLSRPSSAPGTPKSATPPPLDATGPPHFSFPTLQRSTSSSALSKPDPQAPGLEAQPLSEPPPPQRRQSLLYCCLCGLGLLLLTFAMKFSILCSSAPQRSLRQPQALAAALPCPAHAPPAPAPPPPTIHIALTACGNPSPKEPEYFGLLALKSLLMARAQSPAARARAYAFHVITDVSEEELFGAHKVNYDVQRLVAAEPALLSLHVYSASIVDEFSKVLGLRAPSAVPHTIFKNCAAARLKLPLFIPPSIQRVIYLDWDVAALSDLTELWGEFAALEASGPRAALGMALNDPTGLSSKDSYRAPGALPAPRAGGVNSGVMLWQLERLRAGEGLSAWWEGLLRVVEERVALDKAEYWSLTKAFPLGDQDILNILLSPLHAPHLLHLLPERYNRCLVDALPPEWLDSKGYARTPPSIIHFCGSRLTQEGMLEDGQAPSAQDRATKALYTYLTSYIVLDSRLPPGLVEAA